MRVALYARFSDEKQNELSAGDQLAMMRDTLAKRGWTEVAAFTDPEISGATLANRPGMVALLAAAAERRFDVVMAEAMDRMARDQESSAHIFKRLTFHGVRLETLSQGVVTKMHVGLFGMMDDIFLDELGKKTRRGQIAKVRAGGSGGGRCYGYRPGAEAGQLVVEPAEAKIVTRILEAYAGGKSGKAIAAMLNAEGVPGPRGGTWSQTTITGDRRCGDGILHQQLYIGVRVFNRRRFRKDPDTGRRAGVLNPPDQWIHQAAPDLRIISDDLWARAQAAVGAWGGQLEGAAIADRPRQRRPARLLSGLIRCAACGGRMTLNGQKYACANKRERGTCDNGKCISAPRLEARVLDGFRKALVQPVALQKAVRDFHASADAARRAAMRDRAPMERELADLKQRLQRATDAYMGGAMEMDDYAAATRPLKARRSALEAQLASAAAADIEAAGAPIQLQPQALAFYREAVDHLEEALEDPDAGEVRDALRRIIHQVEFQPREGMGAYGLEVAIATKALLGFPRRALDVFALAATPKVWGGDGCGDRI